MKILIYLGHPAHFHLFKNIVSQLIQNGNDALITIKSKDVLSDLMAESDFPYINISPSGRNDGKFGIINGMISRTISHFKIIIKHFKPDLLISSSAELSILGRIFNIPFINIFEDDLTLFPKYSAIFGPMIDLMVCPDSCQTGKLERKTIHYSGNQELAYLHPEYFQPDYNKVKDIINLSNKNFIIRFSKLKAWHDQGVTGLTNQIVNRIISLLEPYGKIHITSEGNISPVLEKYRISINSLDMHHLLFYSDLFIGDSQTMTAESAVLGTPSLRFNDFAGKLGYLEELEHKYNLTYGFKTNEQEKLFAKINELIIKKDLKKIYKERAEIMTKEKINVTNYFVWFIENYPQSIETLRKDPDYQYNFK